MSPLVLPDLLLAVLALCILGWELVGGRDRNGLFHLTWSGLLGILLLVALLDHQGSVLLLGRYRLNGFALLCKEIFLLSALLTVVLSRSYFDRGGDGRGPLGHQGEFYLLIVVATLGMFTVVSATDLLTLFVGMELATIPLYVLCGYRKGDRLAVEGAVKYIVMGALATGVLLFGYSFLYGAAGGLGFEELAHAASRNPADPLLRIGALFVLAAIGFKLTLFPFHLWAPDVYEGATTPVAAFLSVSSKATGIAFLLVMLYGPLAPLHPLLLPGILVVAAITMTVGNLGALRQRNLRRFMAYSSIAQAGYILLAMAGERLQGTGAILYYLLVYAVANYAAFFVIAVIGRQRRERFSSLRGLARQSPGLAGILMLAMFSLAGIPPLAGFTGKFMLFAAAAQQGFYLMVVFAALNSTISLYYYLLVIKEAYIVQPEGELAALTLTTTQKAGLWPLAAAMILLGLLPQFSSRILPFLQ